MVRGSVATALSFIVMALAGHAVAAQLAAGQTQTVIGAAEAQRRACAMLPHSPNPETGQISMTWLTDETLPSPEDARLLANRTDEMSGCWDSYVRAIGTVRPDLVPLLREGWIKNQLSMAAMVKRKITGAEGARQTLANISYLQQGIAAANRELLAERQAQNQASAPETAGSGRLSGRTPALPAPAPALSKLQ